MVFNCPKCLAEPGSHSFYKMKETKEGISVFYTCPAKTKYPNDNQGIMEHYAGIMEDNGSKPWIWIVDSNGFSMEHALNISLAKDLAKMINDKYSHNLKKIIIVNPTWHINTTLAVVKPFLSDRVNQLIYKSKVKFEI